MNKKVYCKRTKAFYRIFAAAACSLLLAGCQAQKPDDYATNQGYSDNSTVSVQNTTGITKENIKVGVIHLSDPAEGSGYTYTHDLGIQGMQQNLGLSDDQIIRKINVDDSDAQKTRTAIQECIDAFALGVYSVNPDAQIYVKVTNSWYSPEAEKAAAATLLDMNCDVITQHCDTLYPQTLAQERGVYSIGYNSDMSKDAPNACLCSVIWNWSAYYTSAVQSVLDGTWDGSNYYGGMNENLVGITELADFCAAGTKQKVDEAKQQILSGKNGVFDGVIETNTGETVGEQGKTLDAATITGKINWYFKTVHVVE